MYFEKYTRWIKLQHFIKRKVLWVKEKVCSSKAMHKFVAKFSADLRVLSWIQRNC